jgi:hypothetical protein
MKWFRVARLSNRWRIRHHELARDLTLKSFINSDLRQKSEYAHLFQKLKFRHATGDYVWQVNIREVLLILRKNGWQLVRRVPPRPKYEAKQIVSLPSQIASPTPNAVGVSELKARIEKLESENERLRMQVSATRRDFLNCALYQRRPISAVRSATAGPGVYFLWKDDTLVYIGVSFSVAKRLTQHASEKIPFFDSYSVLITETNDDAVTLESLFISINKPRFNKSGVSVDPPEWLARSLVGEFGNVP